MNEQPELSGMREPLSRFEASMSRAADSLRRRVDPRTVNSFADAANAFTKGLEMWVARPQLNPSEQLEPRAVASFSEAVETAHRQFLDQFDALLQLTPVVNPADLENCVVVSGLLIDQAVRANLPTFPGPFLALPGNPEEYERPPEVRKIWGDAADRKPPTLSDSSAE